MLDHMVSTIHPRRAAGFTVVELVIAIAIISTLATISLTGFYSFKNAMSVDIAASTLAQVLRRAQVNALAMEGDAMWGIHLAPGALTLFKGVSYAARTTSADRIFDISGPAVSGLTDVVFSKFFGYPDQTGTITLTSANGTSKVLSINAKGNIIY